jgi:hypothetical protein
MMLEWPEFSLQSQDSQEKAVQSTEREQKKVPPGA